MNLEKMTAEDLAHELAMEIAGGMSLGNEHRWKIEEILRRSLELRRLRGAEGGKGHAQMLNALKAAEKVLGRFTEGEAAMDAYAAVSFAIEGAEATGAGAQCPNSPDRQHDWNTVDTDLLPKGYCNFCGLSKLFANIPAESGAVGPEPPRVRNFVGQAIEDLAHRVTDTATRFSASVDIPDEASFSFHSIAQEMNTLMVLAESVKFREEVLAAEPVVSPEVGEQGADDEQAELEAVAEDGLLVEWDKDYKLSFWQVRRLMAEFAIHHKGSHEPEPAQPQIRAEELAKRMYELPANVLRNPWESVSATVRLCWFEKAQAALIALAAIQTEKAALQAGRQREGDK